MHRVCDAEFGRLCSDIKATSLARVGLCHLLLLMRTEARTIILETSRSSSVGSTRSLQNYPALVVSHCGRAAS